MVETRGLIGSVEAADAMVETGLRSIPVVLNSGGRPQLVGMISRGDVIRGFRLAMQDE